MSGADNSGHEPDPGGGEEEPRLSREEIIEREYQIRRRKCDEMQRLIAERCAKAAADDLAAHPWRIDKTLCAMVPVKLVRIEDPLSP